MAKVKHAAVYVRVSSASQDQASQLPDLERWAAASAEPVRWYRDKFTGKTTDRPGWQSLWAEALAGRVSKIVAWRLDRFGRSARDLTALIAELQARGIGLVSMREGLDLSTPAGRLMCHVLASIAQYETEVRSERQTAGIAEAKARGVSFGRPRGGDGKPGKRIKVTPEQERLVPQLAAQGEKVARIARLTGLSRPTVYSILKAATPATGPTG